MCISFEDVGRMTRKASKVIERYKDKTYCILQSIINIKSHTKKRMPSSFQTNRTITRTNYVVYEVHFFSTAVMFQTVLYPCQIQLQIHYRTNDTPFFSNQYLEDMEVSTINHKKNEYR